MSLKAFHIFFVAVAIIGAFGMAAWCAMQFFAGGQSGVLPGGIISLLIGCGLIYYMFKFLHKFKKVSLL